MTYRPLLAPSEHRGVGEWIAALFAFVLLVVGVLLLAGGIWLLALGGSWYYAIAGIGILASAVLIFIGSVAGLWVYFITYALTIAWALSEVGLNGWAQVPRLAAPTVLALIAVFFFPVLYRRSDTRRQWAGYPMPAGVAAVILAAIAVFAILLAESHSGRPASAAELMPNAPPPSTATAANTPQTSSWPEGTTSWKPASATN